MKRSPVGRAQRPGKTQQGVMLLEALIALLVFSLGILALVGLQAAAIKNVSDSQYRVEAALLADTLIAQMRASDPATRSASFATGGTDYNTWLARVSSATTGLPGAATTPPTVAFNNQQVTVTVSWRAQTDTATRQYVTTTELD